jgi:hypothetical protein
MSNSLRTGLIPISSLRPHTGIPRIEATRSAGEHAPNLLAALLWLVSCCNSSLRPHTSAYVSIRQHTSAYVGRMHRGIAGDDSTFRNASFLSAYVSIRQHTSAYVSIRQHTRAHAQRHRRRRLHLPQRVLPVK